MHDNKIDNSIARLNLALEKSKYISKDGKKKLKEISTILEQNKPNKKSAA